MEDCFEGSYLLGSAVWKGVCLIIEWDYGWLGFGGGYDVWFAISGIFIC